MMGRNAFKQQSIVRPKPSDPPEFCVRCEKPITMGSAGKYYHDNKDNDENHVYCTSDWADGQASPGGRSFLTGKLSLLGLFEAIGAYGRAHSGK